MKLKEIIKPEQPRIVYKLRETPIVDLDYMDDRERTDAGSKRSSFGPSVRTITTATWRNDVIGSWKDPRKFRVVLIDVGEGAYDPAGGDRTANPLTKRWNAYAGKQLSDHTVDELEKFGVKPKRGVITLVIFGLDDDSFKLTPWSIAHRFGHAIESYVKKKRKRPPSIFVYNATSDLDDFVYLLSPFKSARELNIDSETEALMELIAQKLVAGRVWFRRLHVVRRDRASALQAPGLHIQPIDAVKTSASFRDTIWPEFEFGEEKEAEEFAKRMNARIDAYEKHLNAVIEEIIKSCVGKIVAA